MAPINALALATVWACVEKPVHDIGVEDEDDADDGLPQMHRGMFMVMAAGAAALLRDRACARESSGSSRLKSDVTCIKFIITGLTLPDRWWFWAAARGSTVTYFPGFAICALGEVPFLLRVR